MTAQEKQDLQQSYVADLLPYCTEYCKATLNEKYPSILDAIENSQSESESDDNSKTNSTQSNAVLINQFSGFKTSNNNNDDDGTEIGLTSSLFGSSKYGFNWPE